MNCKHVQEFIYTDYSDGELSNSRMREIDTHLMHCDACRSLAQKVRENALEPFKGQNVHKGPDEFVWNQIKRRIEQEQPMPSRPQIFVLRPALVLAGLLLILGVGIMTYNNQRVNQQPYLATLINTDISDGDDVGSSIESYFL